MLGSQKKIFANPEKMSVCVAENKTSKHFSFQGVYAYIPAGQILGNGRFVSGTISAIGAVCVQFWYFKSKGGELNVYVRQGGYDYGVDYINSKCGKNVESIDWGDKGTNVSAAFSIIPDQTANADNPFCPEVFVVVRSWSFSSVPW